MDDRATIQARCENGHLFSVEVPRLWTADTPGEYMTCPVCEQVYFVPFGYLVETYGREALGFVPDTITIDGDIKADNGQDVG